MPSIQIKRGTRAQLNAAAAADGLKAGEPYLVTDESVLAIGTSVSTYVDVQPRDGDLTAIANISTNGIPRRTAANTWSTLDPASQTDKTIISDGTNFVLQYPQIQDTEALRRQLLGSPVIVATFHSHLSSANSTLVNQSAYYASIYIPFPVLVTGALYNLTSSPSFTGSNFNGCALYSYSAGTLTKLRETANDENNWKTTGLKQIPFTSTITIGKGIYYIGFLYSASAATTAPTLRAIASTGLAFGETNSARLFCGRTSQTSFPATESMSNLVSSSCFHMAIY